MLWSICIRHFCSWQYPNEFLIATSAYSTFFCRNYYFYRRVYPQINLTNTYMHASWTTLINLQLYSFQNDDVQHKRQSLLSYLYLLFFWFPPALELVTHCFVSVLRFWVTVHAYPLQFLQDLYSFYRVPFLDRKEAHQGSRWQLSNQSLFVTRMGSAIFFSCWQHMGTSWMYGCVNVFVQLVGDDRSKWERHGSKSLVQLVTIDHKKTKRNASNRRQVHNYSSIYII